MEGTRVKSTGRRGSLWRVQITFNVRLITRQEIFIAGRRVK